MDVLTRIKQLIVRDQVKFSEKARDEMELDHIAEVEVLESVLNADRIDKVLVSNSPWSRRHREKLYVIKSCTYAGRPLYTKGAIRSEPSTEVFYILVSAKLTTDRA